MAVLDTLLTRNAAFAAQRFSPLPLRSTLNTLIVTCVDPRVDPAHILGLELGEAAVIRNIGGRVTPDTLQTLSLLMHLPRPDGSRSLASLNLVLLQHTDCGITRLQGFPDQLARYLGIATDQLDAMAISDPRAAVEADVAMLAATFTPPSNIVVSGLVYDVATGLTNTVVAPTPLGNGRDVPPS